MPERIFNETKNIELDENGLPIKVFGQMQDITEIRHLEKSQKLIGEELTQLVDSANAPTFGIDTMGNVNEWNQKAAQITGYTKLEVLGKPFVETYIT